jgi:hypothetical protein
MLSKIYNFSHPLTQQQRDDICAAYHLTSGDIEIVNIKVQLDLNEDLRPQCSRIADQCEFSAGEDVYIVLPGMAPAAVVLVDLLQCRGAKVNVIRIGQMSTPTGMVFPFKEIISL